MRRAPQDVVEGSGGSGGRWKLWHLTVLATAAAVFAMLPAALDEAAGTFLLGGDQTAVLILAVTAVILSALALNTLIPYPEFTIIDEIREEARESARRHREFMDSMARSREAMIESMKETSRANEMRHREFMDSMARSREAMIESMKETSRANEMRHREFTDSPAGSREAAGGGVKEDAGEAGRDARGAVRESGRQNGAAGPPAERDD